MCGKGKTVEMFSLFTLLSIMLRFQLLLWDKRQTSAESGGSTANLHVPWFLIHPPQWQCRNSPPVGSCSFIHVSVKRWKAIQIFFFNCHEFLNCAALLLMKPWEGRKEKHVSVEKTQTKPVILGNINKTKIKLSYLLVRCLNQMYSELLQTQMSKCTLHGNNTAWTDQIGAESPEQPVSTDGKNFVLF